MISLDGIRLITIDGDGTLWDFEATMSKALEYSAVQFVERLRASGGASSVSSTDLRRLRDEVAARPNFLDSSMEEIRRASFAEAASHLGLNDGEFVDAVYRDYMDYRFRHLIHYQDSRPFLTRVRSAGMLVALVTNGNTSATKAGLAEDIDESFVAHEVGIKKPDHRLYRHVLERMGVEAERTVHIGDDPVEDVDAARRAGLTAVWLDRAGRGWPHYLTPAAFRITSLLDCLH